MAQLMTQAEYARHRGVRPSAVSNWKKAGHLVFGEDDDGKLKVDVVRTDARLNARLDPLRGRPSGSALTDPAESDEGVAPALPLAGAKPSELNVERLEELRERRIGSALKNAQLARDLVPLIEAEQRVSEVGRAARERMQAWLRSVAERFAAERDARAIMTLGEEGIDRVFDELADAAESGVFADDDGDEGETAAEAVVEAEAA